MFEQLMHVVMYYSLHTALGTAGIHGGPAIAVCIVALCIAGIVCKEKK